MRGKASSSRRLRAIFFFVGLLAVGALPSHSITQEAGAPLGYFLHVDLGPGWQTTVSLTNLEDEKVGISLFALDQDGRSLGEIPAALILDAQSTQTFELKRLLAPGSETIKLDSPADIAAVATITNSTGTKAEAIQAIEEASNQLDFPRLLKGDQDNKTITLLNANATPASLQIVALDDSGFELQRIALAALQPMSSRSYAVKDVLSLTARQQVATIRVISDEKILGQQLVDPPDGDLVGLPALSTRSKSWSLPIADKGGDFELWTAVGLVNPGDHSTAVTVEAFDASGKPIGVIDSTTIAPSGTRFLTTSNLSGGIPAETAAVKVTADQSLSSYEVIGVQGGKGVTAVLGIPVEDETTAGFDLAGSEDGRTLMVGQAMRMANGIVKSTLGTPTSGQWSKRLTAIPFRAQGTGGLSIGGSVQQAQSTVTPNTIRENKPESQQQPEFSDPSAATDRIPNDQAATFFPRWLPIASQQAIANSNAKCGIVQDFAVDPAGVVHFAGVSSGGVFYTNNRHDTRDIVAGLSACFDVSTGPAGSVKIAAAPDGKITVLWFQSNDVLVRTFTPSGGWLSAQRIASSTVSGGTMVLYDHPSVFYDSQSNLHLEIGRQTTASNDKGELTQDDREILRSFNLGPFIVVASGSALGPNASNYPDIGSAQIWAGPTGGQNDWHVAWFQITRKSDQQGKVLHQSPALGGGTVGEISDPFSSGGQKFAFAVDREGKAHFVVLFVTPDNLHQALYLVRSQDGTLSSAELVPLQSPGNVALGLDINARMQPVILFQEFVNPILTQIAYAKRVHNPEWEQQQGTPWAVQRPFTSRFPGFFVRKFQLGNQGEPAHFLVASTQNIGAYSRNIEHNLAQQDAFVMYSAGPNSTANVATGNLTFQLPLFSSRGAGFATAVSLIYNSLDSEVGPLGPGWTHNYVMTLTRYTLAPGTPNRDAHVLRFGDGRTVVFEFDAGRGFWLAKNEFSVFSKLEFGVAPVASDEYLLTDKLGTKYIFRSDGKIKEIQDTNSNKIAFTYEANDQSQLSSKLLPGAAQNVLTKITDSMGRETKFRYDENDRLKEVEDPAHALYQLTYNTDGNLKKVKFAAAPDATEVAWRFEYHQDNDPVAIDSVPDVFNRKGYLARVFTPRGNNENYSHEFYYLLDGRLRLARAPQTDFISEAGGTEKAQAKYVFTYVDRPPKNAQGNTNPQTAIVQNRRGFNTNVEYEYRRSLGPKITDAQSHFITRQFDDVSTGFRNLQNVTDKRGNITTYTYYTPQESTPNFVGDNVKDILRPGVSNPITYNYTSDGLNRVRTITDSRTNTTTNEYDTAGNLRFITYPQISGQTEVCREELVYDPAVGKGRVTTSISARQFSTQLFYDDPITGLTTSVLRPDHTKRERLEYDNLGNTTKRTLPEGGQTDFVLDGLYRVRTQLDPASDQGRTETRFEYDEDSKLRFTRVNPTLPTTEPRRQDTEYTYDSLNRKRKTTNPDGKLMESSYDREDNTRQVTDFNGKATRFVYDELNRVMQEERPGSPLQVSTFQYDEDGNLKYRTSMGDAQHTSQTSSFEYDVRNNLQKTTHPINALADHNFYDANDNLIASVRRDAGTFKYGDFNSYDERNRLKGKTQLTSDPGSNITPTTSISGFTTQFGYDCDNNRTLVTDPLNKMIAFNYDKSNRLTDTIDSVVGGIGNIVSKLGYNDNDLQSAAQIQNPAGAGLITNNTFIYSDKNELKQVQSPIDMGVQQSFYDLSGNLVRQIDAEGNVKEFTYDKLNRVIEQRVFLDSSTVSVTKFKYDANGNRIEIEDPVGFVYTLGYDDANRLTSLTYPPVNGVATNESWTYNLLGNLESHTDANGKVATFGYDLLNRLINETHGAPFNKTIMRDYNGASNLKFVDDGTVRVEFPEYDLLNRLKKVNWLVNNQPFKSIGYDYDDASNRRTLTGPEGEVFTYIYYPENNRLRFIQRAPSTGPSITFADVGYDTAGRRRSITLPNGTVIRYDYDLKERLGNIRALRSGNENDVISSFTYGYNRIDNRTLTKLDHLNVQTDYAYNGAPWLTGENWSGPGIGAQLPPYQAGYIYEDERGNRTRLTTNQILDKPQAGTAEEYGYDYAHRLVSYKRTDGNQVTQNWSYLYAPTGERLNKKNELTGETEWYMYDGADVIADYKGPAAPSAALTASYVNGLAIDSKIARISPSGEQFFYIPDALGSVHRFINQQQGVVNTQVTTAWGQDLRFDEGIPDRYGFTQRERDNESSLIHYRARSYDPRTARFVLRDPKGYMDAMNSYQYVNGNPINFVDPLGTQAKPVTQMTDEEFKAYIKGLTAIVEQDRKAISQKIKEREQQKQESGDLQMRLNLLNAQLNGLRAVEGAIGKGQLQLDNAKNLYQTQVAKTLSLELGAELTVLALKTLPIYNTEVEVGLLSLKNVGRVLKGVKFFVKTKALLDKIEKAEGIIEGIEKVKDIKEKVEKFESLRKEVKEIEKKFEEESKPGK